MMKVEFIPILQCSNKGPEKLNSVFKRFKIKNRLLHGSIKTVTHNEIKTEIEKSLLQFYTLSEGYICLPEADYQKRCAWGELQSRSAFFQEEPRQGTEH